MPKEDDDPRHRDQRHEPYARSQSTSISQRGSLSPRPTLSTPSHNEDHIEAPYSQSLTSSSQPQTPHKSLAMTPAVSDQPIPARVDKGPTGAANWVSADGVLSEYKPIPFPVLTSHNGQWRVGIPRGEVEQFLSSWKKVSGRFEAVTTGDTEDAFMLNVDIKKDLAALEGLGVFRDTHRLVTGDWALMFLSRGVFLMQVKGCSSVEQDLEIFAKPPLPVDRPDSAKGKDTLVHGQSELPAHHRIRSGYRPILPPPIPSSLYHSSSALKGYNEKQSSSSPAQNVPQAAFSGASTEHCASTTQNICSPQAGCSDPQSLLKPIADAGGRSSQLLSVSESATENQPCEPSVQAFGPPLDLEGYAEKPTSPSALVHRGFDQRLQSQQIAQGFQQSRGHDEG